MTLVHELTHALDDQVFGLERPELEERTDEADFGFSALVEGNASRVDAAYVESLSPDEQVEYFRQAAEAAGGVDFDAFPPVLLLEEQFVYGNGLEFVQALVDDGRQRCGRRCVRLAAAHLGGRARARDLSAGRGGRVGAAARRGR